MHIPVRKIGPKKGINRRCLVARKSSDQSMVFGESLLERDFVRYCNFQPEIVRIEYQPLTIGYNFKRRARRYTPDFRLTDDQGETTIVEVKPSTEVNNPDNVIKFEVAQIFCDEQGWNFKLVTELDLRKGKLSNNINLLLDVMRFEFNTSDVMLVYDRLKAVGPCSINELQLLTPEVDRATYTAIVYKLLLERYFNADLVSQRLSDQTTIAINVGKRW